MSFKEDLKIKQIVSLKSIGILRDNIGESNLSEKVKTILKSIKKSREV